MSSADPPALVGAQIYRMAGWQPCLCLSLSLRRTTGALCRALLVLLVSSLWLCLMRGISAPISSLYLFVPDGAMHLHMNVPKAMGMTLWIGVRGFGGCAFLKSLHNHPPTTKTHVWSRAVSHGPRTVLYALQSRAGYLRRFTEPRPYVGPFVVRCSCGVRTMA